MKFDLKYLVLTMLTPLCVSAGDQGNQLPEGNTVTLRSGAYTAAEEKSHVAGASAKDETSPETNVSTDLRLLTFKEARSLWHHGGDNGRDIARHTLHTLMREEQSANCFGTSQKLLILPRLLLSDNEGDQEVASNYCEVVLLKEEHEDYHEDYEGLRELIKKEKEKEIENKLKLIGLIAQ